MPSPSAALTFAACLAVAGCGRFGFGASDAGASAVDSSIDHDAADAGRSPDAEESMEAGPSDAGNAGTDASSCRATAEVCDGVDNDCDSTVDEGCPCTIRVEALAPTSSTNSTTRLTSTGAGGFGISMAVHEPSINAATPHFIQVDATGSRIGEVISASLNPHALGLWNHGVAWTGSAFGFMWMDRRDLPTSGNAEEVYFRLISPDYTFLTAETRITNHPGFVAYPQLAWSGEVFGLLWYDGRDYTEGVDNNYEIYFTRVDASGAKLGGDINVSAWPYISWFPHMIWDPVHDQFVACWIDGRDGSSEVFVRMIGEDGSLRTAERPVTTNEESNACSVIAIPEGYAVVYSTNTTGTPTRKVTYIDALARPVPSLPDLVLGPNLPMIGWDGEHLGAAWSERRGGGEPAIYFQRRELDGTMVGGEILVNPPTVGTALWDLQWSGDAFGVTWQDTTLGRPRALFARVACP